MDWQQLVPDMSELEMRTRKAALPYYLAAFKPLFHQKTGAFWVNLAEKIGHLV